MRMDGKPGDAGELTLQGDLYYGTVNSFCSDAKSSNEFGDGNALARYTHNFSEHRRAAVRSRLFLLRVTRPE